MYDKKVSIEVDHSDLDIYELLEVFHKLTLASGYIDDSWRDAIKELGELYTEEDTDGI
jgi:ABC-type Fe2+-enterobactin transport system substrate-binding protein